MPSCQPRPRARLASGTGRSSCWRRLSRGHGVARRAEAHHADEESRLDRIWRSAARILRRRESSRRKPSGAISRSMHSRDQGSTPDTRLRTAAPSPAWLHPPACPPVLCRAHGARFPLPVYGHLSSSSPRCAPRVRLEGDQPTAAESSSKCQRSLSGFTARRCPWRSSSVKRLRSGAMCNGALGTLQDKRAQTPTAWAKRPQSPHTRPISRALLISDQPQPHE